MGLGSTTPPPGGFQPWSFLRASIITTEHIPPAVPTCCASSRPAHRDKVGDGGRQQLPSPRPLLSAGTKTKKFLCSSTPSARAAVQAAGRRLLRSPFEGRRRSGHRSQTPSECVLRCLRSYDFLPKLPLPNWEGSIEADALSRQLAAGLNAVLCGAQEGMKVEIENE